MRLPSFNPLLMGAILSFVLFNSCVKSPPNFDPRDANNVYSGCRVGSINGIPFVYNRNNDPVSFIHAGATGTGNPNFFFKYDNKGRLIEYAALDDKNTFELLHRYSYNQQRIVTDTFYFMGTYGSTVSYASKSIYYPAYDNLNRVVEDSVVSTSFSGATGYSITKYIYNAAGNLDNGYTFDNKLNPHRTNKIWMFIDRNYSVNNPVPASTYNNAGLPLTFPGKSTLALRFNFNFYDGFTTIAYDCK